MTKNTPSPIPKNNTAAGAQPAPGAKPAPDAKPAPFAERLRQRRAADAAATAAQREHASTFYWRCVLAVATGDDEDTLDLAELDKALVVLSRTDTDFDGDVGRMRQVVEHEEEYGVEAQRVERARVDAIWQPAAEELAKLKPRVAELEEIVRTAKAGLSWYSQLARESMNALHPVLKELRERGAPGSSMEVTA